MKNITLVILLVLFAAALVACGGEEEPTPAVVMQPHPVVVATPTRAPQEVCGDRMLVANGEEFVVMGVGRFRLTSQFRSAENGLPRPDLTWIDRDSRVEEWVTSFSLFESIGRSVLVPFPGGTLEGPIWAEIQAYGQDGSKFVVYGADRQICTYD